MATDMWSLGIISALMLTGEFVFEDFKKENASPAAALNAAAEYDLAKMVHSPLWQSVSNLAKDFVRNLLVLDEKARLNVEQALEHVWFTDHKRREVIQHQYEEAIEGWMPSRPLLDFKEDLALFRQASKSTLDVRPHSLHDPSVLTIHKSILMPPPVRPSSKRFLPRPTPPLEYGQRSSPFFSVAMCDGATDITERGLKSDDDADKPSILPKPAITTDQRQKSESREKIMAECDAQKPVKSSAIQLGGGEHEELSHGELSQRILQSSIELDYAESRLYDRVSREEASTFQSAKSYRQSVEKRRRLGH